MTSARTYQIRSFQKRALYELELDENTANEAHITRFDLVPGANEIRIEAPENSGYQYDLESQFHIPWNETEEDTEGISDILSDLKDGASDRF